MTAKQLLAELQKERYDEKDLHVVAQVDGDGQTAEIVSIYHDDDAKRAVLVLEGRINV